MTTDFLLSFDGTCCSGPNGMDYSGGRKKLLKIDGFVTYNILHVAIRRKLGMSNNEYINRILHRLPVAFGPPIEYSYMEVSDDDDVRTIIAVGRDFPTVKYITLYIEKQIMDAPQFGYQGSHEGFDNRPNNSELMDNMQYMDYASRMDFSVQDVNDVVETPFQYANFDTSEDEEEPHLHAVEDEESQSLIMYNEGWVVNNQEEGIKDATLNEDMIWATKEEMIRSVKRYSWKVNCDYHVVESKKHCWVVQCLLAGSGCQWYFRGSLKKGQLTYWGVAKYRQPHTCMANRTTEDHRQLDSKFIARYIRRRVEGQPTIPIQSIITEVHDNLKIKPFYKKAWDAKQKAMAMIWGGWKESYNMLPRWFAACQAANPGTVVQWEYSYCYPGTMNYLPQGTRMFHRVFWAFKPCIDAFKKCFPILFIDGTWLYGKYKQVLLIATAVDGNNVIIPICFALVEGENINSWPWFLLQIKLHITDPANICIISDRHPGIRKAMTTDICGWGPSSGAVWRYCLRHVASNYNTKFKCDRIKNLMKVAGQRTQQRKLDNCLNRIKAAHMESYLWIEKVGLERWTLAKDGGYRYGHMTTNISECMNNVFKKVRHLPVAALVTETFNNPLYETGKMTHYTPGDIFRANGRWWALEDEFYYPLNPTAINSAAVAQTMLDEWTYRLSQANWLRADARNFNVKVPRAKAINMPRINAHYMHMALIRIREENNRIKIRLDRYEWSQRIKEFVDIGDIQSARQYIFMLQNGSAELPSNDGNSSSVQVNEFASDIEMSDEDS